MNITTSISIFSLILLIASILVYQKISKPQLIPQYEETWWGPANNRQIIDESIKPFKIIFTDDEINDLKNRLNRTRDLTPPLEGTAWTYGISGSFLKNTIINYWLNNYDFKTRINKLNDFSQYQTNIQGLNIHFIHIKPTKNTKGKKIIPLLMLHGWPGSCVAEFQKIIPLLTAPKENQEIIFEIIAPSLPGFGFSDAAVKPGLGSPQIAVVLKNLMLKLGFDEFYVHGGDWGAIIIAQMSSLFPNHVLGMHSSMCTASSFKNTMKTLLYSLKPSLWLDEDYALQMKPLQEQIKNRWMGTGYLHAQATYPDTVGVGPSDSPASLAAIILEKFSFGTNRLNKFKDDGGLFEKFTPDILIDNLMLYWIPNSMTTAMRIYAESLNSNTNALTIMWPVEVPSACIQFPNELVYQSPEFLKERFINLIQVTRMPTGGHFSSLEEPEAVAVDILNFVIKVEQSRRQKI